LPKEFLKKGYNMALKIKNREEAIAVLRDMVQRKKEMELFFSLEKNNYLLTEQENNISNVILGLIKIICPADQ
jgi:hypothetical protein